MTLRERLLALADEGDAKKWALNRHALAIAAARMALDEARDVAGSRAANDWADKHDVCSALSSLQYSLSATSSE